MRFIGLTYVLLSATCANADQTTILGSANSYAVLGGTVTNTGSSALSGNLGSSTPVTGFASVTLTNGSIYSGSGPASIALADATSGYNYLAGMTSTSILTGQNLGSLTLTPGVYKFESSAELTGILTLDFQNLNDADLIFQIGSSLTLDSGATISVINMGIGDNVYYQVGSSATLGSSSALRGVILANTSITIGTGASMGCGAAIAISGAVTLDTDNITTCSSTGSNVSSYSNRSAPSSVTPEPSSLLLLATGLPVMVGLFRLKTMPSDD